jgi:outer membrane protein OmpA-like peptidoglycan-associated protein
MAWLQAALVALALALPGPLRAQTDPFAGGWILVPDGSTLGFQSVKNETKVESSTFATFSGTISAQGDAEVRVALDSVDTKIDLRNVRMRFLFFETFKFPEAVITAHVDPAMIADLPTKRRITLAMPYTLDLHGVKMQRSADVVVTLVSDDLVAVSSVGTIPVAATDFDLAQGVTKLEEAASVKIVPSGSVTFDWLFKRAGAASAPAAPATEPARTALETTGNFDAEACKGRFEILSNAGNINFRSGSAKLDVAGSAILDNLFDIVSRCPDMKLEIGGHTDDAGSEATNLALSGKRAASVIAYLVGKGIPADRLVARGYGEAVPLVSNDTAANMARNRRIELKVVN